MSPLASYKATMQVFCLHRPCIRPDLNLTGLHKVNSAGQTPITMLHCYVNNIICRAVEASLSSGISMFGRGVFFYCRYLPGWKIADRPKFNFLGGTVALFSDRQCGKMTLSCLTPSFLRSGVPAHPSDHTRNSLSEKC